MPNKPVGPWWKVAQGLAKRSGVGRGGPVVGGERFAKGYTRTAAKHEQSTRQGPTETGAKGGRYYVSRSGTKVYVK